MYPPLVIYSSTSTKSLPQVYNCIK